MSSVRRSSLLHEMKGKIQRWVADSSVSCSCFSVTARSSPLLAPFAPLMAAAPPGLPSVCLCAIVKNERVNPAGGIVAYLDRILPAVHTAVIVDTGSDDGTLEALRARESTERRSGRGHLHVFETPFVSFADARNDALRKALEVRDHQMREGRSTFKHMLILDADEVLSPSCIELLASVLALDRSDAPSAGPDSLVPSLVKSSSSSLTLTDKSSRSSAVHSASPSSNAISPPRRRSRAPSAAVECSAAAAAATAAATAEAAMLAEAFAGFMLPAAALAPPTPAAAPSSSLPYPLALKCSCHCYAESGLASPRSNSGLWNPRIFSADARFSFVNLVDNYRFERLLFAGREISPECYMRESDLPDSVRANYEALRAQELRAASSDSSSSSGAAGAGTTGGDSPSSANSNKDFDFSCGGSVGSSSTAVTDSLSPSSPAECVDDSFDLRVSSPSCGRSQPLLLPMRHFIPSLAGRRKKNQAYKEGGARAKAAAAAAAQVVAGGAAPSSSLDSPASAETSLSSRRPSLSGSYSPLPPGSRSPQPSKSTPSSRSRIAIYQPTNSMEA